MSDDRHLTSRLPNDNSTRAPGHVIPVGDHFEHEHSYECPCGPRWYTEQVAGRGYVSVWQHKIVQATPTPDYPPQEIL